MALGALAAAGALALSACGSDTNSGGGSKAGASSSSSSGSIACGSGKGQLLGSGSTAQQNAMDQWIKDYQAACSGTTINYGGGGSSTGRTNFLDGKTTFAGSDAPLKAAEITQSKKVCSSGSAIDLPMVGGPIAIAYNLPGVDNLVLDAKTLAGIFSGSITKWNAPEIAKLNPGAKLPSSTIQAFHRSDGSGTTYNFSGYLNDAAGTGAWKFGQTSDWPTKTGQSAKGSDGLAAQVKQVQGSISYFELSYAKNSQLQTAKINTGASAPVAVSTDAAAKAISTAKVVGQGSDLALHLDYATKADGAYPISLVTYEIVCDKGNKAATLPALKSFLKYTASSAGQQSIAQLGYLSLPSAISDKVTAQIDKLG
ncbi:phosphate ABC transporter substrate-binding protein PstS [Mangrovactinospora gilvigrisea]|uniref:Phosphate-binding protein n=2 Tax=Mangrovactinospora gilvigrisea TaxID=1428644 RepID=A0A1J7BTY0_9ACTN|nr:phosphate ABC transporter substrate-binding protein PstS [Mangrovactinospora gilvigrisea]OIV36905.1 phosphate ABC transporter substrate-binding protein PstS [Mangrovactinospora gilvigrisea]